MSALEVGREEGWNIIVTIQYSVLSCVLANDESNKYEAIGIIRYKS
jgi:hypothetical protein